MKFKIWFDANKVLIIGALSALSVVLIPYVKDTTKPISWPAVGTAAGLVLLSYFAKNWRGQGLTITGLIGIAADTVFAQITTGTFSWERAVLGLIVSTIAAATPDPKSRAYENQPAIRDAKVQGEIDLPAALTSISVKEEAAIQKARS